MVSKTKGRPQYATAEDDRKFKEDYARRHGEPGATPPPSVPNTLAIRYSAEFVGFVNVSLTDEEKAEYEDWSVDANLWAWLNEVAADGGVVSIKLDPKSGGFMAALTHRRVGGVNEGRCVTMRSKDAAVALMRLMFVCETKLPERWSDYLQERGGDQW